MVRAEIPPGFPNKERSQPHKAVDNQVVQIGAGTTIRKRLSNPPLRVGADQANAVFFQFHGKSSW
ncbi:hypothetical protein, partial [Acidithiobacillus thiooxidans]|uniref:hypothetical protein n=1 Tax=Acidithiobacillus thiooxidans TaxID=930 RepID=UPI001C079CF7